jgi:hypothetical protein
MDQDDVPGACTAIAREILDAKQIKFSRNFDAITAPTQENSLGVGNCLQMQRKPRCRHAKEDKENGP